MTEAGHVPSDVRDAIIYVDHTSLIMEANSDREKLVLDVEDYLNTTLVCSGTVAHHFEVAARACDNQRICNLLIEATRVPLWRGKAADVWHSIRNFRL
jgi:hypothetical protein